MESENGKKMFHSRLEQLIGSEKPFAWASKLGISPATFTRMWKEGVLPKASTLIRISEETDVSLDWLLTGRGKMLQEPTETPAAFADTYLFVPRIVADTLGDNQTSSCDETIDALAFKKEWILEMGWNPDRLRVIFARGDGMEPTIRDGVILLVDLGQERAEAEGIYILKCARQLIARRIQRLLDGTIKIKSDNPAYDDQVITEKDLEAIKIIGRVVWGGVRY